MQKLRTRRLVLGLILACAPLGIASAEVIRAANVTYDKDTVITASEFEGTKVGEGIISNVQGHAEDQTITIKGPHSLTIKYTSNQTPFMPVGINAQNHKIIVEGKEGILNLDIDCSDGAYKHFTYLQSVRTDGKDSSAVFNVKALNIKARTNNKVVASGLFSQINTSIVVNGDYNADVEASNNAMGLAVTGEDKGDGSRGNITLKGNVDVKVRSTSHTADNVTYGLHSSGFCTLDMLKHDGNVRIDVSSEGQYGVIGIGAGNGAQVHAGTNGKPLKNLTVLADGMYRSFGLFAKGGSKIDANAVNLNIDPEVKSGDQAIAAYAEGVGTVININKEALPGGTQVVRGVLYSIDGAQINLGLSGANSVLDSYAIANDAYTTKGKAGTFPAGTINLTLQKGATWKLKHNARQKLNHITSLTNEGGIIDMTHTPGDQVLKVDNYKGHGGTIRLDTDLANETNGDKVQITTAQPGVTYIEVQDASLKKIAGSGGNVGGATGATAGDGAAGLNSGQVMQSKKLLLVTDASEQATFVGKSLDTGGLWEYEAKVDKEGDSWYLNMVKPKAGSRAKVVIGNVEERYGLWRTALTDDTLRQRVGDLRFADTEDGVWVRMKSGKVGGDLYDASYQTYQLGYDQLAGQSIYGVAVDHSRGASSFAGGSDNRHSMTSLSLYGAAYHSSGAYSDVVLKVGRVKTDYGAWGYGASYEVGKNFAQPDGWYVEPQGQLSYGRLQGGSYHSTKYLVVPGGSNQSPGGVAVQQAAANSFIGRLGFTAGRRLGRGSAYYLKANLYREFAAKNSMHLSYQDQTMDYEHSYRDNWFELGIGGNARIAKNTHFYGDLLKTFGGEVHKKWQVNAGIRWEW